MHFKGMVCMTFIYYFNSAFAYVTSHKKDVCCSLQQKCINMNYKS